MMTAEEIEERFSISQAQVEEWSAAWERGELPGEPVGEVTYGRPPVSYTPLDVYKRQVVAAAVDECHLGGVQPLDRLCGGFLARIECRRARAVPCVGFEHLDRLIENVT